MNTSTMKVNLMVLLGLVCAPIARANVWADCSSRYGGQVNAEATGTFTTGSLLDSRHGSNTSGPTMANVRDWHAGKGGRSITFRTEDVQLNARQTTFVSQGTPLKPFVLRDATVLHFDHPEVTNADESVTCKRSSLYFPLCETWGSPTALTYLLRFRLDKEQFLKTSGDWDYCNILMSDYEYSGDGGHGFIVWVKPTEDDTKVYLCHGNRMVGDDIKTGLSLTNGEYPNRSENWVEMAIVVKDATHLRIGVALPGSKMQWVDKVCSCATLLPRANYGIMLGGSGASGDTAQSHLECTRMSVHLFAAWTRALSDQEVFEAFADSGMAVVRVGCAGAADEAFAADGSSDVTFDGSCADWRALPKTLPAGRSVSLTFTPDAGNEGLPQLARVTPASTSPDGVVEVSVDGAVIGTADVRAGSVASVFVPGAKLGSGAHTLTFRSVSGALVLDSYELWGSRAYGKHGQHWKDKGSDGTSPFCLEGANLKNMSYSPGQEFVLSLPADVAAQNRYSYTSYFAESGGSINMTLTVNGKQKALFESPRVGDVYPVTVEFRPGELQAGENTFKWTCAGSWMILDDHIFKVGKAPTGLALIFN